MMDMHDIILDRISFGGVKELEEIYFNGYLLKDGTVCTACPSLAAAALEA